MSSTTALKSKSLALSNKKLQHLPTIVRGVCGRVESDSDETGSMCSDAAEEVSKGETSYTDFDERKDGISHISSNPEYTNVTDQSVDYFTDDQVRRFKFSIFKPPICEMERICKWEVLFH